MNKIRFAFLAPCLLVALLSGCASVTGSKMQPLSVETVKGDESVEDAKCSLTNDKGKWFVTTPGSVTIQKSYGDLVLVCKKGGYKSGTLSVRSSANGGVVGNIVAGGLIGYAIDSSSGAGFDYPTNLTVEMGKSAVMSPPKAPDSGKKTTND